MDLPKLASFAFEARLEAQVGLTTFEKQTHARKASKE